MHVHNGVLVNTTNARAQWSPKHNQYTNASTQYGVLNTNNARAQYGFLNTNNARAQYGFLNITNARTQYGVLNTTGNRRAQYGVRSIQCTYIIWAPSCVSKIKLVFSKSNSQKTEATHIPLVLMRRCVLLL